MSFTNQPQGNSLFSNNSLQSNNNTLLGNNNPMQQDSFSVPAAQVSQAAQGQNAPPVWNDLYKEYTNQDWFKKQQSQYGGQIDRAWNADDGTKAAKQAIDDLYTTRLGEYNKANGTNVQADQSMLGVNAQPNDWNHQQNPSAGFFNHPIQDISDTVSHVGKVISSNPLARFAISAGGQFLGIPANMTMAALAANDIGQGADLGSVLKGTALSYAGAQIPGMVDTGSQFGNNLISNTGQNLLRGQNIGDSLKNSAVDAGVGSTGLFNSQGNNFVSGGIKTAINGGNVGNYIGRNASNALINQSLQLARNGSMFNG